MIRAAANAFQLTGATVVVAAVVVRIALNDKGALLGVALGLAVFFAGVVFEAIANLLDRRR